MPCFPAAFLRATSTALPVAMVVSMPPVVMAGPSIFALVFMIAFVTTPMVPSRVFLYISARNGLIPMVLPSIRFTVVFAFNSPSLRMVIILW